MGRKESRMSTCSFCQNRNIWPKCIPVDVVTEIIYEEIEITDCSKYDPIETRER